MDLTSLAALIAGGLAVAGSLARLVGENGVRAIHHEGEKLDLYLSVADEGAILAVQFDRRSSLGLVRLRVRSVGRKVGRAFAEMAEQAAQDSGHHEAFQAELTQISEADIDNLFTS
ncbi:MAG TPA: roadblock/LC7 domain-containing protein [Candidatus Acidoferrum sp.]|nr:roadblock/LC7 domain-containing protein [Candidatus Acidoferrum sp.]